MRRPALPAKLATRRLHGVIDRERLFALLDSERERPLQWITGPAGAGKTTLVSTYLARRRIPVLWYHVDDGDIDVPTFFSWLSQGAAALTRKRSLKLPAPTAEYLLDLPGFARRFFRLFFAALPAGSALVLDAFENAPVGALLHMLPLALAELPPGMRLLVTSRTAPPPALAPLAGRGEMAVLSWDELRLQADEAVAIAGLVARLPEDAARRLYGACDGWAAGFVLLLRYLRRGGSLDDALAPGVLREQLFPYYLSELFDQADRSSQELLLHTAVLPAFTAEQAAALVPDTQAHGIVEWLYRRHFFVDCGTGAAPVYRYHALFREFLLQQGRERIALPLRNALLVQAARLLQTQGQAEDALALLTEAGAWPEAASLLCEQAPRLLGQGRNMTLDSTIGKLPEDVLHDAPWLLYWRGAARMPFDPPQARAALEAAFDGFERGGDMTGGLLACGAILDSYLLQWSDVRPIDHWGRVFASLLRRHGPFASAEVEVRALSSLAALNLRGHLHGELIHYARRRVHELIPQIADPTQRLVAANYVGINCVFGGDWSRLGQLSQYVSATIPRDAVSPMHWLLWSLTLAGEAIGNGHFRRALEVVADAESLALASNILAFGVVIAGSGTWAAVNLDELASCDTFIARMRAASHPANIQHIANIEYQSAVVALARGDARLARELALASVEKTTSSGADLLTSMGRVILALTETELGNFAAAEHELGCITAFASAAGLGAPVHAALMVRAWIACRSGRSDDALAILREALPIGRAQGYRVILPWVPSAMLQALGVLALRAGIEPTYVRDLLRARRIEPPDGDAEGWPWPVKVLTLGGFAVLLGGQPLGLGPKAPKKPLELLKAMIALGSDGVSLAAIGEHLWPELDGAAAQNAFNVALHRLRKLLGDDDAVHLHDGRLSLARKRVWVDVWTFQQLVSRAVDASEAEPVPALRSLADRLLALYRGDFLDDEPAPWALACRDRLHSQCLRACTRLAGLLEHVACFDEAIELQRRVIELDPLAEAFHRGLIRCLLAAGRSAEALGAYHRCRDLLQRHLGVAPSALTQELTAHLRS